MTRERFSVERPGMDSQRQPDHSGPKLLMVAVDDSQQSKWAARVAAELAHSLGAGVVLVHVMDVDHAGASEVAFPGSDVRAALRRRAEDVFEAAWSEVPASVPTQRLLREGDAGREIVASADEWEADLIVMGTHGRGRLASFLLGGTAEAVIRGARCPVVTVSHDPRRPAPPDADRVYPASVAL